MTDYSDAISLFPPDNQVAAARVAVAPNPDQTAKIIPIAKQLGIPPALARPIQHFGPSAPGSRWRRRILEQLHF